MKNIMLLTWEYPPLSHGPIAHYAKKLAEKLSEKNNVIVLTYDNHKPNEFFLERDSLFVFTIKNSFDGAYNPLIWALTMSTDIEKKALDILDGVDIHAIHAQDWLTLPAAIVLKKRFDIPLFLTLHSIEPVRVGGNSDSYIESVKKIEYEGCKLASKIFVNNLWMKYQVMYHYNVPENRIVVCIGDRWEEEILRNYAEVKKIESS